jgi:two-component system, sensor histidine kinase and response regulator
MKHTILVIEDSAMIRLNICEWLELEQYNVHSAEDGIDGLWFINNFQLDLIICDIDMPRLDGFGVLEALRKNPEQAKIPFIFLTAETDQNSRWKAMQLGANDYLNKPIKLDDFSEAITNQLNPHPRVNQHRLEELCAVFN